MHTIISEVIGVFPIICGAGITIVYRGRVIHSCRSSDQETVKQETQCSSLKDIKKSDMLAQDIQ